MSTRRGIPLAAVWALAGEVAWGQCEPQRVVSPARWDTASFGRAVQVCGDVAVVADPSDHAFCPVFTCASGAVHVFRRISGSWEREVTIYHSRVSERDVFGAAISMDGPSRFAAGAPGEDVAGFETGAIYIFEHDGEAWREVAEILPVEPEWDNGFGGTLVLRGDTLVTGQLYSNIVWVYRERDGRWEFDQKIAAPGPPSPSWFSFGLALDGDWLAIGAPLDGEFVYGGGAAYTYRRYGGGEFEFVEKLHGPIGEIARFGWAVEMAEGRLVVGAPELDEKAGAVFFYELEGGRWRVKDAVRRPPSVRTELGSSLAMHGESVIAGAPQERIGDTHGAAYAFSRRAEGSWLQAARLLPANPSANFGASVATDGAGVIVGAPDESVGAGSSPGAAHIFDLLCLLCRADLDGDGELTFLDFLAFQNLFGAGDMTADFDGDGALTFFDFLAFQNEFMAGCS
jgi:hypothetical protein